MDNRPLQNLEVLNSPSRLIVLAAMFISAIAASSPAWPAVVKNPGVPGMLSLDGVTSGMLLLRTIIPSR